MKIPRLAQCWERIERARESSTWLDTSTVRLGVAGPNPFFARLEVQVLGRAIVAGEICNISLTSGKSSYLLPSG